MVQQKTGERASVARPRGGVRSRRTVGRAPATASEILRERTRHSHDRAEAAFDLERRLTSRTAYADLLERLRGFYAPMEVALSAWERRTDAPGLGVTPRCRAHLLDSDLAQLGRRTEVVPGRPDGSSDLPADDPALATSGTAVAPPPLMARPQALGWLYVLEGSALGGQLVARHAQATLGPDIPVAFFTGAGLTDLGARWRSLRKRLDEIDAPGDGRAVDHVVDAADQAYGLFERWLLTTVPAG